MDLYFSPLACSMATRIALYEAGADAIYHPVDLKTKRLAGGADFRALNPMGQVPVLRTDTGELVTENPVVLQTVADRYPDAGLLPQSGIARTKVLQWTNFITTELHKLVFQPLLDPASNDGAKAYARTKAGPRFAHLDAHLDTREFLVERFTIADCYLVTTLNWTRAVAIDLTAWPAVLAYYKRTLARPSVARAVAEEFALYQAEQQRGAA
ncbi:MAG: glutathione S-transferase N-terminal domain-containing protein [Proteobacteria bacterium]|nr:glutathione S-transferase N-terminal domain-containing protein [Pseudomonadota bacterium]